MTEKTIAMKIDEITERLERLEKLVGEQYPQTIQNYLDNRIETLKQDIQTEIAALPFAQASTDLTALVEGFSRIEKELKSLAPQEESSQLLQNLTVHLEGLEKSVGERLDLMEKTLGARLESFEKQVNGISTDFSEFTSEIMIPQTGKMEMQPGEQISTAFRHKLELKEVLASLYDYLRWVNDPPGSIKSKTDITKELEKARDLAQATHENGSLPLTLRNSAYEVARIISDTRKKVNHSDKGRFYAEDMEPIGAPLIRHLKHLISILE